LGRDSGAGPFQLNVNFPGAYELLYRLQVQIPFAPTAQQSVGPLYYARMDINAVRDLEGVTLNAVQANELEVRFNIQGDTSLAPAPMANALILNPRGSLLPDVVRPPSIAIPGQPRKYTP